MDIHQKNGHHLRDEELRSMSKTGNVGGETLELDDPDDYKDITVLNPPKNIKANYMQLPPPDRLHHGQFSKAKYHSPELICRYVARRVLAALAGDSTLQFAVGDDVMRRAPDGSIEARRVVVAAFRTLSGEPQYVIESEAASGTLEIVDESQLVEVSSFRDA